MFNYSSSSCNDDELLCNKGSKGPFCGSCDVGYVYRGVTNSCEPCGKAQSFSIIVIGCMIGIVIVIGIGGYLKWKEFIVVRFLSNLDSGSLKVMWVTYQIIVSSSFTLDITFPSPFSNMLGFLTIFSLDFLALECLDRNGNAYFVTVYLWCIIPILLGFMILLIGIIRILISSSFNSLIENNNENNNEKEEERRERIINQHIWLCLFLSYLVLPPVSSKQLQSFDCISLESGHLYLRSDTSIDCESSSYLQFRGVVILFLMIYQMIPILWMILLFGRREELNPSTSNHDEKLASFIRESNSKLATLRFLFQDYKCSKWWFEIAEMYRRIVFIGIIPLISPRSSVRSSFGLILAILSIIYFREEQPYRVEFTNLIAYVAQICILVTFYSALTISIANDVINFGLEGNNLGVFLLVINLMIFVLSFDLAWRSFQKQQKEEELKLKKAKFTEDARGFSKNKFNTTFESIWHNSISSSHVVCFFYTSTKFAENCRKSGIPALKKFNGVPISLRSPYDATENDFKVFSDLSEFLSKKFPNEEVLVLGLPKQFLEVLPGFEDDPCLCMISTEVLMAMRPSSFTAVVESRPWLNGIVLLSPHCILRSFLIMDPDQSSNSDSFLNSSDIFMNGLNNNNNNNNKTSSVSSPSSSIIERIESLSEVKYVLDSMKSCEIDRVIPVTSIVEYIKSMKQIRQKAFKQKLVPLYHYTSLNVAPLILKSGFRMSTQGQGDGGVYFSTLGPASYGLGTLDYEVNIIKDCFGVERVDEYKGKGKLEVVIIYGCEANVLHQAPGGRDNAKMIAKSTFREFSLEQKDGNYFLRADRILGAFVVNSKEKFLMNEKIIGELKVERNFEGNSIEKLENAEIGKWKTAHRIEKEVEKIFKTKSNAEIEDDEDDNISNEFGLEMKSPNSSSLISNQFKYPSIRAENPILETENPIEQRDVLRRSSNQNSVVNLSSSTEI